MQLPQLIPRFAVSVTEQKAQIYTIHYERKSAMPIITNDTSISAVKNAVKSAYNVKFFCKDFTGTGKAVGLINTAMNPVNLPPKLPKFDIKAASPENKIVTDTDKYTKTVTYPIDPLGNFSRVLTKTQKLKQKIRVLLKHTIMQILKQYSMFLLKHMIIPTF